MNVVYEGDVVGRVPVQAVGGAGEWNCVQQSVDRSNNLQLTFIYHLHQSSGATHICSVLLSRAVDDRQTAGDEVVLRVGFLYTLFFKINKNRDLDIHNN